MPKSAVGHRVAFNMAKLAFASEVRHSLLSIHRELVSLANTPNRDLSQPLVGVCVCLCITFVACPWLVWRAVVTKACNYRKKEEVCCSAQTRAANLCDSLQAVRVFREVRVRECARERVHFANL